MRFSAGIWRMKDGVHPYCVARVALHYVAHGQLVLRCVHKGETKNNLNNYGITIRLTSPLPGVIHVRATHLAGRVRKGPFFQVPPDRIDEVSVSEDADSITFD